jgi:hypothetical protein
MTSTARVVRALHAIVGLNSQFPTSSGRVVHGTMCKRPMARSVQLVYETLEEGEEV